VQSSKIISAKVKKTWKEASSYNKGFVSGIIIFQFIPLKRIKIISKATGSIKNVLTGINTRISEVTSKYLKKTKAAVQKIFLSTRAQYGLKKLHKIIKQDEIDKAMSGWSVQKKNRYLERLDLVDEENIAYLGDDFAKHAAAFEKGGKYNVVKFDDFQEIKESIIAFEKNNGKFKFNRNKYNMKGTYDYIIKDGKIKIGLSHMKLVGKNIDATVDYAGQIRFTDGVFKTFNNKSGHFKPDGNDLINAQKVLDILKKDMPSLKNLQLKDVFTLKDI